MNKCVKGPFQVDRLPTDRNQRRMLYRTVRPAYEGAYGKRDGRIAFSHAKKVTELVAHYIAKCDKPQYAGKCILLAAVHALRGNSHIPDLLLQKLSDTVDEEKTTKLLDSIALLDGYVQLPGRLLGALSPEDASMLQHSFVSYELLRMQDEADPVQKNRQVYVELMRPRLLGNGAQDRLVLPEAAVVRTIDLSETQFFEGQHAEILHDLMSNGGKQFPRVVKNMAYSMLDWWRGAAVKLLFLSCYDNQSNIIANVLYPGLFRRTVSLFKSMREEISTVECNFSKMLREIVARADNVGIPIVTKTDRETGEPLSHFIRKKTPGSTTIKLVDRELLRGDGSDFSRAVVLENIHDLIASMLVCTEVWYAEALFALINKRYGNRIVKADPLFYNNLEREGSLPGYSGIGHIDFRASEFGAKKMARTELHLRSIGSNWDYHFGRASRAFRGTKLMDAWGDYDIGKMVEALNPPRFDPASLNCRN